ncbi:ricin-type beta-trefoil lectin domain protein [Rhodococcus sp. AW25M09]|uniref:ricin-type beta-trefoil lectin domain protein n=1 Tax=Rhodococcus sp. AW25M09 TaxID=1268303 RepID=UPI000346CE27|nr:ricin-type beta-trefoil lectin domain protein [Rhodococcus sp. AW25M09]
MIVTVCVLVVGCSVFSNDDGPPAQPAVTFTGQFESAGSYCLDGSDTDPTGSVRLAACNGTQAQRWVAEADGTVRVRSQCLVLDSDSAAAAGTSVVLSTCDGDNVATWEAGDSSSIGLAGTSLCLAVAGVQQDRKRAIVAECDGSSAQVFEPVAAAEPNTDNPGGVAAPTGDLPGWKQIFVDEFTAPSANGSWANECDPTKVVYTGSEGQRWRTYPSCYPDTYDKRPYRPDAVLSTTDGALEYHLGQVDGIPAGASISPVIDGDSQYQTYGRYSARFKVESPDLSEYYAAWLLWPRSENWPYDGELDFPEGALSGNVGGFHHFSGEGSCADGCKVAATDIGAQFTDWHTYTMEWSPGRVRYLLDETVVLDSTDYVPASPMRWELQTETKGDGNSEGNLILDWVSVYSWTG